MNKLLPDLASLEICNEWGRKRCELSRQLPQPASAETLIKIIGETDFHDEDSRTEQCNMLGTDLLSYIALGMHCNYHYCLRPDLMQLVAEDDDVDWQDTLEILPECIHGINISRITTNPGSGGNQPKNTGSDQPSSNSESTGNDDTDFVFMQLGQVHYLADEYRKKYEQDGKNAVAINNDGKAGAPWLLFNFRPEDEIEGDRITIRQSGREWGTLLGDSTQRFGDTQRVGMKIGESLDELRERKAWNLTESHGRDDSAQIVAAVISQDTTRGRITRQKIFEDGRRSD